MCVFAVYLADSHPAGKDGHNHPNEQEEIPDLDFI